MRFAGALVASLVPWISTGHVCRYWQYRIVRTQIHRGSAGLAAALSGGRVPGLASPDE